MGACPSQRTITNAGGTFRDVANSLAGELVQQVTEEHAKTLAGEYKEVMKLRGELERVKDLMEGYLAREKALHDMMDQLMNTFGDATNSFMQAHAQFGDMAKGHLTGADAQRRGMIDPACEQELARIKAILAQPAVPPPEAMPHLHAAMSQQGQRQPTMSQMRPRFN